MTGTWLDRMRESAFHRISELLFLAARADATFDGHSVDDSETKSEEKDTLAYGIDISRRKCRVGRVENGILTCAFNAGTHHTWTSFSFNETRSTICRRAALSGLGFELYAASRIALSLALETSMGSVAAPTCRG